MSKGQRVLDFSIGSGVGSGSALESGVRVGYRVGFRVCGIVQNSSNKYYKMLLYFKLKQFRSSFEFYQT